MSQFAIAIPTYRRADLLRLLLEDVQRQSICPQVVIIVDGDPASGEVLAMLTDFTQTWNVPFHYIPSNHGNLPFQRYLGWRAAAALPLDFLLYLDDDLRIPQADAIETLLTPLQADSHIAGATAEIHMGVMGEKFSKFQVLTDRVPNLDSSWLVQTLGSSHKTPPGSVTPSGHRTLPVIDPQAAWTRIEWLRGGVMAYRMSALKQDCFSQDLFALNGFRAGKGEDTFLSRQVMHYGDLMLVKDAVFEHPNSDTPKTYPITAYRFGLTSAYSRRFLNDHYRISGPPHFSDRVDLLKSYLGNNLINLMRAISHPARHRFAYAWGYFVGSLRGVLQKPTAGNLTPGIAWWQDAEEALAGQVVLS